MKRINGIIAIAIIVLSIIPVLPLKVSAQTPYQSCWNMDRPQKDIHFNQTDYNVEPPERVEECNTDEYASIGLGVEICDYNEQHGAPPYGGRDGVSLRPVVTANTRKGIQYYPLYFDYLTEWYDPVGLTDTGITGDNAGVWINIPFYVRFYGGPGAQNTSFTYTRVWVSSNGFLCFQSSSNSSSPQFGPDEPNGLIGVYWADLHPSGGKITYWNQSSDFFVVAWWKVLNKGNGQRETFEVVIENTRVPGFPADYAVARGQNRIKLLYQSVSDYAVSGIENQEGSIATGVSGPLNGKSVWLAPTNTSPEIRELSIIASKKEDSHAEIMLTHITPKGHNMDWLNEEDDDSGIYEKAFAGFLILLMTEAAGWINPLAGIGLETLLLTTELAYEAAKASWPAHYLSWDDAGYSEDTAYITASAAYKPFYPFGDGHWPVDAWLATTIDWIFEEQDGLSHSIDIWGRLVYYVDGVGSRIIETPPVTIEMTPDIGQTRGTEKNVTPGTYYGCLDTADRADLYSFNVPTSDYVINVSMTPPGSANFNLYLYDSSGNCKNSSRNDYNLTENIVYLAKTGGTWYVNVTWVDWPGGHKLDGVYRLVVNEPYPAPKLTVLTKTTGGSSFSGVEIYVDFNWHYSPIYNLALLPGTHTITTKAYFQIGDYEYTFQYWENGATSNTRTINIQSDKTITAFYKQEYNPPPPGGGCPYVYIWNGTGYVLDNNVLGMSEVSNGADVEDYYKLEQTLVPTYQCRWFSQYSMQINEFEHEHSYIDKIRLYAVDHDANVNVAVTPDGQILTYTNPNTPISVLDNYGYDWLPFVSTPDNIYYRGFPGDYLLIDFGSIDTSQAAKLVLRANVELKKDQCIHVQVLNETSQWTDAAILRTRNHWSTIILNLADYLPNPDGTLKIRLYFTGIHKIDYIGLDTTPQADITVTQTIAFSAIHSTQGDVTLKLLLNDQKYAELIPNEQITLKFLLPNTQKTRTFITYTEGHYNKTQ